MTCIKSFQIQQCIVHVATYSFSLNLVNCFETVVITCVARGGCVCQGDSMISLKLGRDEGIGEVD